MPAAPRAPTHRRPTTAQSIAAAVITVLVLLFLLGQCASSASTSPAPSRTTTPAAPVTAPTSAETFQATPPPEPTGDETTDVDVVAQPPPTPAPRLAPTSDYNDDTDSSGGSVYYKNCSAAKTAGAAPLYAGEPGYAAHLDRDSDGVACES